MSRRSASPKRSRLRTLLLVAAAPVVISCQLLLDHRDLRPDPDPPDATNPLPVDPCVHTSPPPAPEAGQDEDPNTANDYWFATERIIVPMNADAGVKPGIDLDDSCTCQPDKRDGAAPCETPAGNGISCDFDGGVDDAFGAVSAEYAGLLQDYDLSNVVNRRIQSGDRTFLVYLTGYNGKAYDVEVGVAIVSAGGLYDDGGCGGTDPPLPDTDRSVLLHSPRWDGCDRWSAFVGKAVGDYPKKRTTTTPAYVSNYTLVARIQSISADFLGASVTMTLGAAVATLIPDDAGSFRLEGFIAGRLGSTDAASVVGRTEFVLGDGGKAPLCASQIWPTVASTLCSARDSMQLASSDFTGDVCNAITTTIGFAARPAQVSNDEYTPPPRTIDCDAAFDCH